MLDAGPLLKKPYRVEVVYDTSAPATVRVKALRIQKESDSSGFVEVDVKNDDLVTEILEMVRATTDDSIGCRGDYVQESEHNDKLLKELTIQWRKVSKVEKRDEEPLSFDEEQALYFYVDVDSVIRYWPKSDALTCKHTDGRGLCLDCVTYITKDSDILARIKWLGQR